MAERRTDPRGIKPSSTNGDVLKTVGGVTVWVAPSGVQSITAGRYIKIDNTDPLNPVIRAMVPMTTKVSGNWEIVFDTNGQIVYTEGP